MNELLARNESLELTLKEVLSNLPTQADKINDSEEYESTIALIQKLKQYEATVVEYYAEAKKKAHDIHKGICDEEASYLRPIRHAINIGKKAVSDYLAAKEAEKRRKEEELRAAARAEAERIMAEAAKLESQGLDASDLIEEAVLTESVGNSMIVETKKENNGASTRKDWKITSVSTAEVPCEIAGVVIRPVDETAILRLIRATKGTIKIPGIEYQESSTIIVRR